MTLAVNKSNIRHHGNPLPRLCRDGYTRREGSPTSMQAFVEGKWRRVYELCFSNCPTLFVKVDGIPHYIYIA